MASLVVVGAGVEGFGFVEIAVLCRQHEYGGSRRRPGAAPGRFGSAIETGDTDAMNDLGWLFYERGELAEAEVWSRRAVDRGLAAESGVVDESLAAAMDTLGVVLKAGAELVEAESWLRQTAEAGNPEATYNLGTLLKEQGQTDEGEEWLARAAQAGFEHPGFL